MHYNPKKAATVTSKSSIAALGTHVDIEKNGTKVKIML